MYRAYCFNCNTLVFDVPSAGALLEGKESAKITCRGCGRTFVITSEGKDIFYQSGRRKPVKAVYYH